MVATYMPFTGKGVLGSPGLIRVTRGRKGGIKRIVLE